MTNKNLEIELKVGFFILSGIILSLFAILMLNTPQSLFSKTVSYTAHFSQAEGLINGAKVILNGLNVGAIDTIELDSKTRQIKTYFHLSETASHWITEGTTVEITTQGVLGDKFLSLEAGPSGSPILSANSDLPYRPSANLNKFLNQGDHLITSIQQVANRLDHLIQVFEIDSRSEKFFKGISIMATQLAQITEKINNTLNEPQLSQIKDTLSQIHSIIEKINNGNGTLGAFLNDAELYENLNELMGGINRNRIFRNLIRKTIKESSQKD